MAKLQTIDKDNPRNIDPQKQKYQNRETSIHRRIGFVHHDIEDKEILGDIENYRGYQ